MIREFIRQISSKKALYLTVRGYKVQKMDKLPVELNKQELGLYKQYKRNAENRGYTFELSTDTFQRLIHSDCVYCGKKPIQKFGELDYNGIDRINNNEGYNIDNCLACCKICNRGKGTLNYSEYLVHLKSLVSHLKPIFDSFDSGDLKKSTEEMIHIQKNAGAIVPLIEEEAIRLAKDRPDKYIFKETRADRHNRLFLESINNPMGASASHEGQIPQDS
ncbi:MAG: HNH endonuclease, partial [Nitrososphaeraceae archaeon]|nr:HNH endonuclease [Nitrososphaeraceae archaeon]